MLDSIKPLVSIITPVFNGGLYLEKTIESVLKQSYPNIEYIVLDDGSTDETLEILSRYTGRIKWYSHKNMGQSQTLNKGWALSQGELLGYISADDLLHPDAIAKLVNLFYHNGNAVVVFPNCNLIDPHGRVIKNKVCRPFDYEALVVEQECYIGAGALFKRSVYEQFGGWKSELRLAPDREFWMRAGMVGDFIMHPEVLSSYRMHEKAQSYYLCDKNAADEYIKVIDEYYKQPMIPPQLEQKKSLAFSNAYIVAGRIHLRGGRLKLAWEYFKKAQTLNPQMQYLSTMIIVFRTLVSRNLHRIYWIFRELLPFSKKGKLKLGHMRH